METFTISRRAAWAHLGEIKVEIECDPLTSLPRKLGLAVRAAVASWANLAGANLAGADLAGADLAWANLSGADLAGADLAGANLSGADLAGADLAGANLSRANLEWANVAGADLAWANLSQADLAGANLSQADLAGANLAWANVAGADLSRADLAGEKIKSLVVSASRSDGYAFYAFALEAGGVKIQAGCRWFTPTEYRAHIAAEYPDTDKARETGRILDLIEGRAEDLGLTPAKPKRVRKTKEAA